MMSPEWALEPSGIGDGGRVGWGGGEVDQPNPLGHRPHIRRKYKSEPTIQHNNNNHHLYLSNFKMVMVGLLDVAHTAM